MTTTLEGKVSIITGAGQGIGRAFAEGFAAAGAKVVVADAHAAAGEETAGALTAAGHDAIAISADVTDERQVDALVDGTTARFGRVDVLLNNAAVFSTIAMKPFDEIEADEWRKVIDVNLTGVFLCCRAVGRQWKRNAADRRNAGEKRTADGGSIINISSSTVLGGRPNYLHYVASKAGVVGLTRSLARELGAVGARVNAVMPGSVDTGIPRDSIRPGQAEEIVAAQTLHRRLEPDDIVGAAVFLASDAARMITGQTVVVDGGMDFL